MSENNEQSNQSIGGATASVNILEVCLKTIKRWPWIIASVVICVGFAYFHLLRSTPQYTRNACVLIKHDSNGNSVPGSLSEFAEMGLISPNSNLTDELSKLSSPDLMADVVRRLHLDVSYSVSHRFRDEVLYGTTVPFHVDFPSLPETGSASMTVNVNKGNITIDNLIINKEEVGLARNAKVKFGDTIPTNAGTIVITKTPYFVADTTYCINVTKTPMQAAAAGYSAKITLQKDADKSSRSNIINITAVDSSPQRAEDLINTLIDAYNEQWITDRNEISVATSNFINERLQTIEKELGNVDDDISSYQSKNLIPDVQQAASMYMSENQTAATQLTTLDNQLQMTRYLLTYLTTDAKRNALLPANTGIGSQNIETQIATYNTTVLQRNQYAANSSDTHPMVVDLDSQIAAMRTSIISSVNNQIKALETQISNLSNSQSRATARLAANPTQAKYLLSVERQQKVKETLYLYLLQKREENELSQAFAAYNTQVITKPYGTNIPTSPQRGRMLILAFMVGLIIPFGYQYLREITDTRLHGRQDLKNINVPIIGEIPLYEPHKKNDDASRRIVVKQGRRNSINEAFRVLRTNIGFMATSDKPCSVIMVTSFNPGSGKTFITMNTALSLALKGKRVLVIDGDMRRGSTSDYINAPQQGLSNYLIGNISNINDVIVSDTLQENLNVLPVGTIPPNPTELLESNRFTQLIADLRNNYDYIFIDCPPIEMMADAQIIETVADRTLFILRVGLLEKSLLPELDTIAREKKFRNMSLILNATPLENSRYYGKLYDTYYSTDKD
jgi:capsular exopolysaccharide synthesis family protein